MVLSSRIIQISDPHLFATSDGQLLGVNTLESLKAIVQQIHQERYNPDAIIVTGDLTQDGSIGSYEKLKSCLAPLNTPYYWLCGNHDNEELMIRSCPSAMIKRVVLKNWQLLLLNSQTPGEIPGRLSPEELEWLDLQLNNHSEKHTLIALHHHPYILNSAWLDQINLENFHLFQNVISNYRQVRGVIHGHIHQESETSLRGIPCYASPSSCVQFKPKSHNFALDLEKSPGYRVIDLYECGEIQTHITRIKGYIPAADRVSEGY